MKKIYLILHFLALLLIARCTHSPIAEQPIPLAPDLLHIDSLMQSSPDSALHTLLSCHSEYEVRGTSSDINTHYQALLTSEALYKTDNPQNRIELQTAMHYFDSLVACHPDNDDIIMLSARAHYMNGAIFYENDSVVKACEEYLRVLSIIENHFKENKLVGYKAKLMTLTYNRLVDLFSSQFMMEPAIYCAQKSMHFCMIEPTSKYGLSNTIYKLGKYHDILGNNDSAHYYYHEAIEKLSDSNNYVYRDIVSNMALLSYDLNCDAEKSINDFEKILKQTRNDEEILSRYIGIGYIYYNEGLYDSAIVYLKHVFENKSTDVMKLKAAEYLQNIYQSTNNYEEADKYSKYLASNITSKYGDMMEVSILDKLFNDYLEQIKYKQQYHNKKTNLIFITVVSIIITIIISISLHLKNKKIKASDIKYDKEKTKVRKMEKELINKRSEAELRIELFLNEPVCRKINDTICDIPASARSRYSDYTYVKLDEETIVSLGEAVTKHFPNLKIWLISNNIKLKKDDLLLCYLYLLGLNNSQIALLRQCNFATVCRQAKRLKESFTGCKNLPCYIKQIAVK
ncbi:MAG: hypothetical protein II817_01810 [Bacteroidales bacterium]|nr:hypothetical protein [Bacteroidales bacterium]